jgi:hypothetical protein
MNEKRRSENVNWLSLISFGFFLVLLGAIWFATPDLSKKINIFIEDFHFEKMGQNVIPAPEDNHPVVYNAAMQFCLIFGVFQIGILAMRFILNESLDRKADTFGNIVFWLSVGFFLYTLTNQSIGWFGFVAGFIISIGLSIIARAIVKLLGRT